MRWVAGALAILLLLAIAGAFLVLRDGASSSTRVVETFSDQSDTWFVPFANDEATGIVEDGAFLVRIGEEGGFPVVVDDFDPDAKNELPPTSPLPPSDAKLSMEATKVKGPEDTTFGLACRENAPEADAVYYYLGISGDGNAFIEKYADDEVEELRDWQETPAVHPVTETNHIAGECLGGRNGEPLTLRLLVNDREVARATDPDGVPVTFFGFFVGADAPGLEVRIDNFAFERP
jgi:hypothetical protein